MIIKSLNLVDFRLYSKKSFSFSSPLSIIVGVNACGKTNILEAIFCLATGKSFRADKDTEMIKFGKEVGRVKGIIKQLGNDTDQGEDEKKELEIMLTRGEVMGMKAPIKKYTVNGVAKRMVDFAGQLRVSLFWPEDLEMVTGAPGRRRKYLDFVLLQVDREYRRSLQSFEKGIRQRNRILETIRDQGVSRNQLMFWDQLIIKTGKYITAKREEYIHFLNNFQFPITNYQLFYDASVISEDRLEQYKQEEVAAGVTLVGPHRDDIKFRINEELRDLSHFGSRGEQRLGVLWLKLGELRYIEEITGEKPVLLLDDIFSEFDHEHRDIVFEVITKQQSIMTTADPHFINKKKLKDYQIIELI